MPRLLSVVASLGALLTLAPATGARAQDTLQIGALERRIDTIRPAHGPPGTPVHVSTEDMPVITPIRVGFGAPGGFEALLELLTGDRGDFTADIEVPSWATWDRVHLVLVFDIYFRPIARSVPFHVTDERGRIQRRGRVEAAAPCVRFRDLDGIDYALTGLAVPAAGGAARDGVLTVEGRVVEESACGAEVTLEVERYFGDRGR